MILGYCTLRLPTILFIALLFVFSTCTTIAAPKSKVHVNLKDRLKRLNSGHALLFEANRGQVDSNYSFIAQNPSGVLLLSGNGFIYGRGRDAVRVMFEGAELQPRIVGLDLQPGVSNYLLGSNQAKFIRNVPSYGRVRIRNLYPGIDAVYHSSGGSLEADFIVQAATNPGLVRLRIEGGRRRRITAGGDLLVQTRSSLFVLRRPRAYQDIGAVRRKIVCRYVIRGRNEVAIAVSSYDRSQPLVIDPVLSYSSYLGGGNSTAVRVAMDAQGNAYLAGATSSATYPVTSGTVPPPPVSYSNDVLITKFDSQGSLVYSTHVGGSNYDYGLGIAVDANGRAYVTGCTTSQDFPTHSALQSTYQGGSDAFVFALNAVGNDFVYSTYLGGNGTDAGTAIAADAQGNAYIAGSTSSTNFPTMNAVQANLKGGNGGSNQPYFELGDAFVTKLSPSGAIVYSTYYGGSNDESALAIAVDSTGSPYVAGFTTSRDFPVKNPLQSTFGGAGANSQITTGDAFVFKLTPNGGQVVYSTYLGGSADDVACGIAVDSSGNAYLAGSTFSPNFPIANAMQSAYGGQGATDYFRMSSGDAFVAKISSSGAALVFSTFLGGSDDDRAFAIGVDGAGNIHVAGNSASSNFPVTSDAAQKSFGGAGVVNVTNLLPGGFVLAPVGMGDAFYARFSPAGALTYNTYLGGSADDVAGGLAVDAAGDVYLAGNTASTNFPLAGPSYQKQLGPLMAVDSSGNDLTSLLYGDAFFAAFHVQTSSPAIAPANGVISAGQFGAFSSVAPGSWIEIYGSNLAADTRQWASSDFNGNQAPTSLDQTSVTIGGQSAFIDYISPGQVNAQVPSSVGTGSQPVVVTTTGGSSSPFSIMVNQVQPGLLAPNSFAIGGKQYVAALFDDGVTFVLPSGAISGLSSKPAAPGDTIVLYGIGFGPVTPNIPAGQIVQASNTLSSSFQIYVGGAAAQISYAGLAPNYVGLYQFNIVVPNVASGDTVPLTFKLAGTNNSQTLYTAVQ